MTAPLRIGGRLAVGGSLVTWSVAEGSRGRRWREATAHEGALVRAVLLETDPDGRPARLEVATAAGILTLHPAPDQSEIHGNVVTPDGIRHLRFEWSPEHELLVLGSTIGAMVSLTRLAGAMTIGETRSVPMLRIDDGLAPRAVAWRVDRLAALSWRLRSASGDEERMLTLDDQGFVALPDREAWSLELD